MNQRMLGKLSISIFSLLFLVENTRGLSSIEKDHADLKQIEKFAANLQESLENGNPSYFNMSFDTNAFLQKITAENANSMDTGFIKGFQQGLFDNFDFGSMLVDRIKQNGTYKFLHAYKKNDSYFILYRLYNNEGINYHEFEVKLENEKFRITDAYLFMSGEKISETMARIYNSFRIVNTNSGDDSLHYLQAMTELGEINSIASKGKYSKAFKKWQKIPSAFQQDKLFLITGIHIAAHLDEKTYQKIYNLYMLQFPDNSGKYLIPLNGFLLHKNYRMALACIDSLDKKINNDPMLDYLRASLFYDMGNHAEAAKKMTVLINSIPDFETGYYSLLGLYVRDKNYLEATQVLDKIVLAFNYYKNDFASILKEYPDFINSKEYQSWLNQ
jgi:tetratricopeptide (TPR) repeat protein